LLLNFPDNIWNFVSFSCWFLQPSQFNLWHCVRILHFNNMSCYVGWSKVSINISMSNKDASWVVRVCMKIFSTSASVKWEQELYVRVDKSCPDITMHIAKTLVNTSNQLKVHESARELVVKHDSGFHSYQLSCSFDWGEIN
jgi:hypothetical protein